MTYISRSGNTEASVFRLLFPATNVAAPETPVIEAAGQCWHLQAFDAVPRPGAAPEFVCVSYAWGRERTENPFDLDRRMALRARPALEAALVTKAPRAVWFDAACMPTRDPARSLCLRNMGAIYAAAQGVIAVLSRGAAGLLDKIRHRRPIGSEDLECLEQDEWVRRVWTYQEIANSRTISFVAEGATGAPVEGITLSNALGEAIERASKVRGIDAYAFQADHPYLDAFGTLLEDYMMGEHDKRSAYQILCAMEGRSAEDPASRYYAMLGAIIAEPTADPADATLDPTEAVMRACEAKGDFSFVYTSDARAPGEVGGWRPKPEHLSPILRWSSSGARQGGERRDGALCLNNMARLEPGPLEAAGRAYVDAWLGTVRGSLPPDLREAARATLQRAGFAGCGECLETQTGLFFPWQSMAAGGTIAAYAATDVFFRFGAPGLLVDPAGHGIARFRDVGVFVGLIPSTSADVVIGLAAIPGTGGAIAASLHEVR